MDTVWVGDHLIQANPYDSTEDILEAYTALGFAAAHTERVRLGTMVTAVTFRPPALLVKAVTTLDVLSGGRARFGVGAGYHEQEARGMGLPPTAERFERLEETLRLVARYADACNLFDVPGATDAIAGKLTVLRRHCEEAGRPYEQIEKTLSTRLEAGEAPEAFARRAAGFAAIGIDHLVVIVNGPWTQEALTRLGTAATLLPEPTEDAAE